MLRVYFCLAEGDAPAFPDGLLSAYRKEKLALQKNPSVRSRSLFSELLLRYALRDCGFAPEGSALAAFDGEELSDHNAVWAEVQLAPER